MHADAAQVTDRVQRFLAERLRPAIIRDAVPCDLAIFEAAGEPVAVAEALTARYSVVSPGYAWGPPWGTAWLRVRGHLPREWPPELAELAVDLGFDTSMPGFQAEGLLDHDAAGTVIKGIAPRNSHVPVPLLGLKSGDDLLVYIEAAANPPIMGGAESFAPTPLGSRETAGTAPSWRLGTWVNDEAAAAYDELRASLEAIVSRATGALAGGGDGEIIFNAGPRARDGVPALGTAPGPAGHQAQPEVGASRNSNGPNETGCIVLDNGLLRVVIDPDGLLCSVRDLLVGRELIPGDARANMLQLHRDLPARWDAWDIDASYRHQVTDLVGREGIEVVTATEDEALVEVRRSFGAGRASRAIQRIRLRQGARRVEFETEVDWRESEKLLKVAFPLDLRAEHSSAEMQFGHVRRPLHANTPWDAARFEVYAHRFVHVGEAGYGVAIANDATYGHDLSRGTRPDGGTTTTVRLSLVRGPRFPDPRADHGRHRFGYVLAPGADLTDAVGEGYRANLPVRRAPGSRAVPPVVAVDDGGTGAVVVEAVKAADDRSGDLVMRLYEALGGRARATVTPGVAVTEVVETDLLERPVPALPVMVAADGRFAVELRPFQIRTLVLRLGRGGQPLTPPETTRTK
ncbi:MAG: glycoside hydrolase family 38 C-terminal domain-containing protein [Streptosporangiaceae bacterium]